jgi:hypothetical protein
MDGNRSELDSTTLTERLVLLAIADAAVRNETPVASVDIRQRCRGLCESVDAEVLSTPDEPDVMRALSVLGAEPYIEEVRQETSPVGKGRPQYDLDTDPSDVLDALVEDDRLEGTVESVRPS